VEGLLTALAFGVDVEKRTRDGHDLAVLGLPSKVDSGVIAFGKWVQTGPELKGGITGQGPDSHLGQTVGHHGALLDELGPDVSVAIMGSVLVHCLYLLSGVWLSSNEMLVPCPSRGRRLSFSMSPSEHFSGERTRHG
jgi:hypothetical protein